jgi:acetyl esterase
MAMNDAAGPYVPTGPLDPVAAQLAAFFREFPGWQGLKTRPIAETRAAIRAAAPPSEPPQVQRVEEHRVTVPGGDIALRVYWPVARPPAVIVWAHGGGFALGSMDEADGYARTLALATGSAVASVDYRLAPEFQFPTPLDDVLAATQWVAARREELFGGTVPMFLGGDSAGANLATVAARKLHVLGICRVAGNILAYPCTDNEEAPSLRRFAPPFLTVDDISCFFDLYLPDRTQRRHPDFAPLYAQDLGVLPPTFILTAEHDVITEQAEAYGHRLTAAGVDVRIRRYLGMIHGFLVLDAFYAGAAGAATRDIGEFIEETLKTQSADTS